jgi:hypothetical protein
LIWESTVAIRSNLSSSRPLMLAALAFVAAATGCFSPNPAPASASTAPVDYAPDSGPVDAGAGDAGAAAGSFTTKSSGNALPPAWAPTSAGQMVSDGGGAEAQDRLSERATLTLPLTTSTNPCPLPFTASDGTVYCDGFDAKQDGGSSLVADTFSYLGTGAPCAGSLPPADGTALSKISGVWEVKHDNASGADTYVLSLTDCSDVGLGTPYAGTGSAGATTEIATLIASFAAGTTVTVQGVVVAAFGPTGSGAFGFTIEDPAGGPNAGIAVTRSGSSSSSSANPPAVGDVVQVTGTTALQGPKRSIRL